MIRAAKISRFGSFWRVGSERAGFRGWRRVGLGFVGRRSSVASGSATGGEADG